MTLTFKPSHEAASSLSPVTGSGVSQPSCPSVWADTCLWLLGSASLAAWVDCWHHTNPYCLLLWILAVFIRESSQPLALAAAVGISLGTAAGDPLGSLHRRIDAVLLFKTA